MIVLSWGRLLLSQPHEVSAEISIQTVRSSVSSSPQHSVSLFFTWAPLTGSTKFVDWLSSLDLQSRPFKIFWSTLLSSSPGVCSSVEKKSWPTRPPAFRTQVYQGSLALQYSSCVRKFVCGRPAQEGFPSVTWELLRIGPVTWLVDTYAGQLRES